MPKDKGRGGKNRRRAKNTGSDVKRELLFKEEEQEYAQVLKMLGGARCDVYCFDGVKRLATIRGKLVKRVWIHVGDIVLVSLRDFTKDSKKCDILHKYTADEAKKLKAYGEIPDTVELAAGGEVDNNEANVVFDDVDDDEESKNSSDEEPRQRRTFDISESSDEDEDEDEDEDQEKDESDKNSDYGKKRKDSIDDI